MEFRPFAPSMGMSLLAALECADKYIKEDMLSLVDKYPQNTIVLEHDGTILSVASHTAERGDSRASFTAFTGERFRYEGIGTAIVKATICNMIGCGVKTIYTDFEKDDKLSEFAVKVGLRVAFDSHYMEYSGEKLPCDKSITGYTDDMAEAYQSLKNDAFAVIRESAGLKPYRAPYSEKLRENMGSHSDEYYVLFDGERMVGCGRASDGEIDDISVAEDHRRRGIGRALTAYGANKLMDSGCATPSLWVVDKNAPAIALYESLGFKIVRTHTFCILDLMRH